VDLPPAVLLRMMSDELRGYVVDLLREAGGEHLVVPHTIQVTPGVSEYRLPPRAVANGIRRVSVQLETLQPQLPQLSPDALDSAPGGYYLRGARLVLWPTPTEARTLRVDYLLRPSQLVPDTAVGVVTSVTTLGTSLVVEYSGDLGGAASSVPIDVVRASPPFDVLGVEARGSIGQIGGVWRWTVPSAQRALLQEAPEVGDYLCPPDTSPVPQVPLELHALLAQRTAYAVLTALGDAGTSAAYDRCEDMRTQLLAMLRPRDIGARHYVRGGLARGVRGFGARGRGLYR